MSKTYVIQWKSKINGRAGRGTKRFPLEEAQTLVSELNLEYPDIHHELSDSDTDTVVENQLPVEKAQEAAETSGERPSDTAAPNPHAFSP
jgi:hypothetical protein